MEALLSEILQPGFLDPANEDFLSDFCSEDFSLSLSLSEQKSERNRRCMSKPTDRKTSTEEAETQLESKLHRNSRMREILDLLQSWQFTRRQWTFDNEDRLSHLVDEKIFCADVSYGPLQHMIY
jgi:hypothetical protein